MVDTSGNMCQHDVITGSVPNDMEPMPCNSYGTEAPKTSKRGGPRPGFGGPQPGSGRPRKPKPIAPTQISYVTDRARWFCVRTEYGLETEADVAIRSAGFQTFFPLEWVPPVAARRTADGRAIPARSERLVPLLPRYIMVNFSRTDPDWRAIPTMRGVERVISASPERPTPIPDLEIEKLRQGLAPNGCLYPPTAHEPSGVKKRWVDMATALLRFVEAE